MFFIDITKLSTYHVQIAGLTFKKIYRNNFPYSKCRDRYFTAGTIGQMKTVESVSFVNSKKKKAALSMNCYCYSSNTAGYRSFELAINELLTFVTGHQEASKDVHF